METLTAAKINTVNDIPLNKGIPLNPKAKKRKKTTNHIPELADCSVVK
jgi:hypothetical protein